MINFELDKTAIYQAVKTENYYSLFNFLYKFCIFIIAILCLRGITNNDFNVKSLVIFISLAAAFWLEHLFFNFKVKNPLKKQTFSEIIAKPEEFNFASFLSFEAAKVVDKTINFCKNKKLSEIPSSVLFYFLLEEKSNKIKFIFSRAILGTKQLKKGLEEYFKTLKGEKFKKEFSEDFKNVIFEAANTAQRRGEEKIEVGDLLVGLAQKDQLFKKILIETNLKAKDIENINDWVENVERRIEESKKFWEYKNLIKHGSIAEDWASGYTITLDQFSTDWTEVLKKRGFDDIVGHEKELEQIERALSRDQINNVLIVGDPGIGKISIIHSLTEKSFFNLSTSQVNAKRVVALDILSILSKVGNSQKAQTILDTVFKEAINAGNVILVIDDFHNYIGQEERPGIIDIAGIISPYLALPNFQIVALTNYPGLHKNIEPYPAILNLFEKVEVSELTEQETIKLLENKVFYYESKYKKFITYPAIRDIVKLSARYIQTVPFPKKALDLLEGIMVYVSRYTKSQLILSEHVARIVSETTQIPVGEVEKEEKEVLLNLEKLIHQRIVNQEEAVNEVSAALRRARADITVRKGPMGTFLFLGPTGVGKTETSKALAEVYFGKEDKMIRIDMSEFQNIGDISRLIGSPDQEGVLTTQVRENPFALILLDEVEKAHKNILNVFLQVLDEGYVTDGLGRKVDFKNTIIIATSNAGYQIILDAIKIGKTMQEIKGELLDSLFRESTFRPEFINRFDAVVLFKSLTKEHLLKIAELLLAKLKKNLQIKEIEFIITDSLKEKIVELGYDPIFGARQMRRVVQDKIENLLASAILSGQLKAGDKVEIDSEKFEIKK